jgi:hypothetical protein
MYVYVLGIALSRFSGNSFKECVVLEQSAIQVLHSLPSFYLLLTLLTRRDELLPGR